MDAACWMRFNDLRVLGSMVAWWTIISLLKQLFLTDAENRWWYICFISANVLLHPQEGNEVLWWVCLFVCPSVSLPTYLRNHIAELHRIFCACCMWLWLDPPLAVLWSLCTFWFWWHGFILWVLRCIVCILKWWEYSITAETLVSIPTKLGRDQVFIMGCTQRLSLIVCWLVFFFGGGGVLW